MATIKPDAEEIQRHATRVPDDHMQGDGMDAHQYMRHLERAAKALDARDQPRSLSALLACMTIGSTIPRALRIFASGEPRRYERAARLVRDQMGCMRPRLASRATRI